MSCKTDKNDWETLLDSQELEISGLIYGFRCDLCWQKFSETDIRFQPCNECDIHVCINCFDQYQENDICSKCNQANNENAQKIEQCTFISPQDIVYRFGHHPDDNYNDTINNWTGPPRHVFGDTVSMLYHITDKNGACSIHREGKMVCGKTGMLGGGIYFAETIEDARYKAKYKGYLVIAKVLVGKQYIARDSSAGHFTFGILQSMEYDSVYAPNGSGCSTSSAAEWVVYNDDQVCVVQVAILDTKKHKKLFHYSSTKCYLDWFNANDGKILTSWKSIVFGGDDKVYSDNDLENDWKESEDDFDPFCDAIDTDAESDDDDGSYCQFETYYCSDCSERNENNDSDEIKSDDDDEDICESDEAMFVHKKAMCWRGPTALSRMVFGNIMKTLYHVTNKDYAYSIFRNNNEMKCGADDAMFGAGIYFAETIKAAKHKAKHHGYLIKARVFVGNAYIAKNSKSGKFTFDKLQSMQYDSVYAPTGSGHADAECVVYNTDQVFIISMEPYDRDKGVLSKMKAYFRKQY